MDLVLRGSGGSAAVGCESVIITTNNVIISFPFHLHITSLHMEQATEAHTHTLRDKVNVGPHLFHSNNDSK